MAFLRLNQFQIKMLMALLMVTDHLNHIPNLIPNDLALVFHVLTRCVSVWFAYGVVEGVLYTRNLKKYLLRLDIAAIVMILGNNLLESLYASKNIQLSNNIFLTLAIGATILAAIKSVSNKPLAGIIAVVLFVAGIFVAEGAHVVLPFMLISYFAYQKPLVRNVGYLVLSVVLFAMAYVPYETTKETLLMLAYNADFMFITVIPFLYLYNGKTGPRTPFSKYFFYVFYPAHLWLFATIACFVG